MQQFNRWEFVVVNYLEKLYWNYFIPEKGWNNFISEIQNGNLTLHALISSPLIIIVPLSFLGPLKEIVSNINISHTQWKSMLALPGHRLGGVKVNVTLAGPSSWWSESECYPCLAIVLVEWKSMLALPGHRLGGVKVNVTLAGTSSRQNAHLASHFHKLKILSTSIKGFNTYHSLYKLIDL